VPAELARAGFAIHPSRTEGLSNAILEELAAGLPVVAMDVGGNSMLIDPGMNGYLLAVGDHTSLATS
jgi:glycosyltransferase involved in cell wall biosynthesis